MTGFSTFLGFPLLFWQTSFGTSTHSSTGVSLGTSLVTWEPKQDNEYEDNEVSLKSSIFYLHFLCGVRSHSSWGSSWTTVLTSSWHCSGPGTNPQPAGPHRRCGIFSHLVTGFAWSSVTEWILTWSMTSTPSTLDLNSLAMVHTSLGHLLHFWSVT